MGKGEEAIVAKDSLWVDKVEMAADDGAGGSIVARFGYADNLVRLALKACASSRSPRPSSQRRFSVKRIHPRVGSILSRMYP